MTFIQGRGGGLYSLEQKNVDSGDVVTRLFPKGGKENVIPGEGDEDGRLVLPEKYIEDFTETTKVVERVVVFDDIHPTFQGKVGVLSDANNKSFICAEIDFDIKELAVGSDARVNFLTGDLMGKAFEFKWNNEAKKITLIGQIDELAVIDPKTKSKPVIPDANKYLRGGELFTLIGLRMSGTYKANAVDKLRQKGVEWLGYNCRKRVKYSLEVDYRILRGKRSLSVGDLVTVKDEKRGINSTIRITSTEKNLLTGKISCIVSNYLDEKWEKKIEGQIASTQAAISGGVSSGNVDIIEENDARECTDRRVFSSLRTIKELLNRSLSKTHSDRTPYSLVVGQDLEVEHLIKALTRLEVGEAVDSLLAGKGIIAENGRIQADRMELRSSLTVLRLIINEIQAMAGDYSFSDCGYIERVDKIDGTTYKLWMEKRTDTDWTNLDEHDVLLSIVNSLLTGGTDYYSSWFRCVSKNRNENSLTVVLYPDSEVPGGKNYPPVSGYNVTRKGNATMPEAGETNERAQSWLISSREGRIMFLQNVFKPILEDYNYAISIGRFPSVKMIRKLPISPTDVGIMAKTIVAENFYQADWNGDIIPKKVDRGEWSLAVAQGESPYRNVSHEVTLENQSVVTQLEQHTVYHYGCKWGCVIDKTADEPKWNAPGWILLEGDKNYHLDFTSTNGWQFFHRSVDTVVSAVVSYGNRDITEVLMASDGVQVEWLRDTGNVPADNAWQPTYVDGKKYAIHLTRADMGSEWGVSVRKVRFVCRVFIPIGGGKFEKTENYIGFKI
ncbi:hypothetical protein [Bacteroides zoogleoformans]|uniref:hypothetical protein n=1 Tax=Bacteroides zoogleoformans TaxID=28119 RepID=UPI00101AD741|nr:hypothetical protein [Bacteroides zoogleoformans]